MWMKWSQHHPTRKWAGCEQTKSVGRKLRSEFWSLSVSPWRCGYRWDPWFHCGVWAGACNSIHGFLPTVILCEPHL